MFSLIGGGGGGAKCPLMHVALLNIFTKCACAENNLLIETVLLSTNNICFVSFNKKLIFD